MHVCVCRMGGYCFEEDPLKGLFSTILLPIDPLSDFEKIGLHSGNSKLTEVRAFTAMCLTCADPFLLEQLRYYNQFLKTFKAM